MGKLSTKRLLRWSVALATVLGSPAYAADLTPAPVAAAQPAATESGPLDLRFAYIGELWHNSGGLKTGSNYMSGLDVNLTADGQKLFGVPDSKIYLEGFYTTGKSLDLTHTQAFQSPSALDAYFTQGLVKLYQAFYQQKFGSTDILVGKYDVQQQFANTRPMDLFGSKAHAMPLTFLLAGVGTGLNGVSAYPDTSLGLRVKQALNDQWTVKLGLLDGLSDRPNHETGFLFEKKYGVLGIGEIDYTPAAHTKIMAGVWGQTGRLTELGQFTPVFQPGQTAPSLVPASTWGQVGGYVGGATRVYTIEGSRGVDVFGNVGFAPEDTDFITRSFDAGVSTTGLFSSRPTDKLGLAVGVAENSSGYRALQAAFGNHILRYETSFEATYRARINDWLVLQPELQYIVHPSGAAQAGGAPLKDALVFGLHFELSKSLF